MVRVHRRRRASPRRRAQLAPFVARRTQDSSNAAAAALVHLASADAAAAADDDNDNSDNDGDADDENDDDNAVVDAAAASGGRRKRRARRHRSRQSYSAKQPPMPGVDHGELINKILQQSTVECLAKRDFTIVYTAAYGTMPRPVELKVTRQWLVYEVALTLQANSTALGITAGFSDMPVNRTRQPAFLKALGVNDGLHSVEQLLAACAAVETELRFCAGFAGERFVSLRTFCAGRAPRGTHGAS